MEVRIGPKSFRSNLPVGFVYGDVVDSIEAADRGQLGKQVYNFNIRIGREVKGEALYQRAYVLNGHCHFKKYSLIDVLVYKLGRLFK